MRDHNQIYDPESQPLRDCSTSDNQRHGESSRSPADEGPVTPAPNAHHIKSLTAELNLPQTELVVITEFGVGHAGQSVLQAGDVFGAAAVFFQDAFGRAVGLYSQSGSVVIRS